MASVNVTKIPEENIMRAEYLGDEYKDALPYSIPAAQIMLSCFDFSNFQLKKISSWVGDKIEASQTVLAPEQVEFFCNTVQERGAYDAISMHGVYKNRPSIIKLLFQTNMVVIDMAIIGKKTPVMELALQVVKALLVAPMFKVGKTTTVDVFLDKGGMWRAKYRGEAYVGLPPHSIPIEEFAKLFSAFLYFDEADVKLCGDRCYMHTEKEKLTFSEAAVLASEMRPKGILVNGFMLLRNEGEQTARKINAGIYFDLEGNTAMMMIRASDIGSNSHMLIRFLSIAVATMLHSLSPRWQGSEPECHVLHLLYSRDENGEETVDFIDSDEYNIVQEDGLSSQDAE